MYKLIIFICCLASAVCVADQVSRDRAVIEDDNVNVFGLKGDLLIEDLNKLNEFLVNNVNSEDPDENLKAVKEAFDKEYEESKVSGAFKTMDDFKQFHFTRGKKLFLALGTVLGNSRCTEYSSHILDQLDRATKHQVRKQTQPGENLRRVEKILKHYIELHKNICQKVYSGKVRAKLETMQNKEAIERVNIATNLAINELTEDSRSASRAQKLYNAISRNKLASQVKPEHVILAMNTLARGDPEEKFLRPANFKLIGKAGVRQNKYKELFSKYLIKPCTYYTRQLEREVFEPANFDLKTGIDFDEDLEQFYEVWLRHKLCKSLLDNNEHILARAFEQLVKQSKWFPNL